MNMCMYICVCNDTCICVEYILTESRKHIYIEGERQRFDMI